MCRVPVVFLSAGAEEQLCFLFIRRTKAETLVFTLYTTVIEHHTSHDMSAAPVTSSPAVWDKGHTVQCTTSADYVIHFYHNNCR